MAVVVFCAYLQGEGGKWTAVRGTDTNIWFTLFTLVLRGDGNKESDHLYSEVYIRVLSCWPGKSVYICTGMLKMKSWSIQSDVRSRRSYVSSRGFSDRRSRTARRIWWGLDPHVTNGNGFVLLVSYSPPCGGLSCEVVWCVGSRVASLFSLSFLETLRAFLWIRTQDNRGQNVILNQTHTRLSSWWVRDELTNI